MKLCDTHMPLAADIVGEGMRAVRPMEGAEKALIAGAYSDNMRDFPICK